MYLFVVARGLNRIVAAHVVVSTTSILYGAFGGSLSDEIMEAESFSHDDPWASWVTSQLDELVNNMYSGRGIPRKKDGPILRFDPNATFEDPAVVCLGHDEIIECFRALKVTNPQHISPPRLLQFAPRKNHKNSWSATYALDQRYGGFLSVRSLLVIHLDVMDETKNTGDGTDKANHNAVLIKKIEERWNGVALLGNIFWYSRRLNGTTSYALTSLLVN
eukprot:CAMPEP_0198304174 /NCGR_PEP_ID=MMETSP1449-20131203/57265_1 /TAXON_ID=420275 /ORGANISM="Attheya septentrionalis, Strain CCMP2084" /LENGTH=218 /DNA_ID=CAMNT_0044006689 /DNA_START=207 /DNA_END=863 /DNA_ORIENTATION=-